MNTVKQWMKTGCALSLVFLTGETPYAEPAQLHCQPSRPMTLALRPQSEQAPARQSCSTALQRQAIAPPRLHQYQGHVLIEPAAGRYVPRIVEDNRRYSF